MHCIWVETAAKEFFNPNDLHLPKDNKDLFFQKISLHCEAAVLRVLLAERRNDDRYEELLNEFERLIFPPKQTIEGMAKLESLRLSINEINALFVEKKEFSWCRQWLQGIGHDETNPATLAIFSQLISLNTRSIREMIHEIGPPS
jgi:hypothetical protein